MENQLNEFKEWIGRNEAQFVSNPELYTPRHVADLAIACGFDRQTVSAWVTSQLFKEAI